VARCERKGHIGMLGDDLGDGLPWPCLLVAHWINERTDNNDVVQMCGRSPEMGGRREARSDPKWNLVLELGISP
jgi:hypothetical protein